jgi:hypothetical protein
MRTGAGMSDLIELVRGACQAGYCEDLTTLLSVCWGFSLEPEAGAALHYLSRCAPPALKEEMADALLARGWDARGFNSEGDLVWQDAQHHFWTTYSSAESRALLITQAERKALVLGWMRCELEAAITNPRGRWREVRVLLKALESGETQVLAHQSRLNQEFDEYLMAYYQDAMRQQQMDLLALARVIDGKKWTSLEFYSNKGWGRLHALAAVNQKLEGL